MPSTFNINVARGLAMGDGFRKIVVDISAGVNPYVTGGEAITAGQFRGGVIEYVDTFILMNAAGTLAILGAWNDATGKLQFFWTGGVVSTALAEVTNGTDLSLFSGRTIVWMR